VQILLGDYTKAKEKLDWVPEVKLPELVKIMIASDIKKLN
jgi:GDPmannose 4,6-dehydratase